MNLTHFNPICPSEGLHVLHFYYQIDHDRLDILDQKTKQDVLHTFAELVEQINRHPKTQIITQSVVSPRADLGIMLLTPDLRDLVRFEKAITASIAKFCAPTYSYFSLTERSEYFPTREEHISKVLLGERGLKKDSEDFQEALASFDQHMAQYVNRRVWPQLPKDWPIVCFYPMSKRRAPEQNWYELDFQQRAQLMAGHGKTGRKYSGKILQLITGSTGLDDMEWGVTLLAKNSEDIKSIVYEMRYDEVSAQYAEFGEFYIGLQQPLPEIFATLGIS